MSTHILTTYLRGSAKRPRFPGGLAWNPFPAIPIYEVQGACLHLQRMADIEFDDPADVEAYVIQGGFDEAFAKEVASRFKLGRMVRISIEFHMQGSACQGYRFLPDKEDL